MLHYVPLHNLRAHCCNGPTLAGVWTLRRSGAGLLCCGHSQTAISSSSLFRNQRCARCCFSSPKSVPPLVLRSQPSSTCWADRRHHHLGVRSAIFELSTPFSDTLHSHYVISVQKHVSPTKPVSHTNFAGTVSQCITIAHQLIL